jgi:hypothetical protein
MADHSPYGCSCGGGLFGFGEHGWMTWLSNAERATAIRALREWIAHNEAPAPTARG